MQGKQDRWWTWRWDRLYVVNKVMEYDSITRWRRGWFTVYRMENWSSVYWWLYLPFNIGIALAHEKRHAVEPSEETAAYNIQHH